MNTASRSNVDRGIRVTSPCTHSGADLGHGFERRIRRVETRDAGVRSASSHPRIELDREHGRSHAPR
jgi:hypothetical protein